MILYQYILPIKAPRYAMPTSANFIFTISGPQVYISHNDNKVGEF